MDCRDGAYCLNFDVDAINTGIVNITATGSSTSYGISSAFIDASNAGELYVYASYAGISGSIISAINADIVNITCIGSSSYKGCSYGLVDASNAGSLYVYASNNGIYGTDIEANNADELYIFASNNGIHGSYIVGQNISTTFEITAIGKITNYTTYGIGYAEIYIPALDADLNKFSLNCYGSGCYSLTFIKKDGFDNIANANLNFNGCYQCQNDSMF